MKKKITIVLEVKGDEHRVFKGEMLPKIVVEDTQDGVEVLAYDLNGNDHKLLLVPDVRVKFVAD